MIFCSKSVKVHLLNQPEDRHRKLRKEKQEEEREKRKQKRNSLKKKVMHAKRTGIQ
jgi:hypothetical protein